MPILPILPEPPKPTPQNPQTKKKVLQGLKPEARRALGPLELRRTAAAFATSAASSQAASFRRYGVWGDFDSPYLTLQKEYEAAQLGVFSAMFLNGHVYRGRKPVHWSPSSMTALAEAELEYPEGHISRSAYVAMPIATLPEEIPEGLAAAVGDVGRASLVVWTTTPWTLPANLAVAVNPALPYAFVEVPAEEGVGVGEVEGAVGGAVAAAAACRVFVAAEALLPALAAAIAAGRSGRGRGSAGAGAPPPPPPPALRVLGVVSGATLAAGCTYSHPFVPGRTGRVVVGGDYVTTESGTGLVHTAPGHGQEDYAVGLREGLPILSPVDATGRFTAEVGVESLVGLDVLGEGTGAVLQLLASTGHLVCEQAYPHKYPYDWRTKKPTIFRATEQWFASVEGFRAEALAAVASAEWFPPTGERRIAAMTEGRADWCISRQRAWGVPLPVFYGAAEGEPLVTRETLEHVQGVVAARGADAWWELPVEDLLPPGPLRDAGARGKYVKGTDTMDVWFDSGSSWAGVLRARKGLNFPADRECPPLIPREANGGWRMAEDSGELRPGAFRARVRLAPWPPPLPSPPLP